MKIKAVFVKDGDWWVAWTDDVPGAITQGKTVEEARENLLDAINEMQKPYDLESLPTAFQPPPCPI
ncbi:MAG: type II toxin-antitoxin system HicB family antitoxin [Nitrospirae bacterium]|nr:type II toxin-antitoxin system HicB family antitoxin [Nitrospirota bacterium]